MPSREKHRLLQLFKDHFNGSPWLDVTIYATLDDITWQEAIQKIGDHNSIWEIVVHMICWRKTNKERVEGKLVYAPENNYFYPVLKPGSRKWKKIKKEFMQSHEEFLTWFQEYDDKKFDTIYSPNHHSYYEHIQGILQHDAYHLGQIVLLKKIIRAYHNR